MRVAATLTQSFRHVCFELLLYLTNRVIARVPLHRVRLFWYRTVMGFEIGRDSFVFMDAWFDGKRQLTIGNNSVVNQRCRLDNRGGIRIGNNVSISAEVCILTADHDMRSKIADGRHRPVTIGNHVFVGTRAMILPGVNLGEGSAVAAGAVVTSDVEPYTIVAGVPARPIGERPAALEYSASYCRLFS